MVELKFELARNGRDLKRGIRKGSALLGPFRIALFLLHKQNNGFIAPRCSSDPVMLTAVGASVSKSMAKEYHMARKKGRIQDVAAAEALAKESQMSETNEDTGLAAEDTIFEAEDTGLATKDIVPTTGKESVVPPLEGVGSRDAGRVRFE